MLPLEDVEEICFWGLQSFALHRYWSDDACILLNLFKNVTSQHSQTQRTTLDSLWGKQTGIFPGEYGEDSFSLRRQHKEEDTFVYSCRIKP